jgi:signal transduction histidine kinase
LFRASPDIPHAAFWIKFLSPINVLTGAAFLHFSFLQTRARAPRWAVFSLYFLFMLTVSAAALGLTVESVTRDPYGFLPHYTSLNLVPVASTYVFLIMGGRNFFRAYKRSMSYDERNSYLYFMIGISVAMIGGIWDYLSTSLNLPPVGLLGTVLFGIMATVAVLRYHLLDIRIVIRKSMAYLLISTIVAIPWVGLILWFNANFHGNIPIWAYGVLLFSLALGLQIAWRPLQNWVDRLFNRERYDFLRELERYSQEVHEIGSLSQTGSSLVDLISRAFQTEDVVLLMANDEGNLRTVSRTAPRSPQSGDIAFSRRSLLVQWFARNRGTLMRQQVDIDPQLQSLTARERADIAGANVQVFVPLKTNTGDMVGLLLMGPKKSEQPYSDEDMRHIMTVASRMAVELENARLYAQELATRQELQLQNEQKTEFLHHVAHELKTPLTAVISSSELMTADNIVDIPLEQRERLLNNINRSAWLMDKKVSELLDLARIQIGRVELKFEPLDVRDVIEDLTSQLSSLFKNKEQSIEVVVPPELPPVRGDRERTAEVVLNLLSNANKFTPAGGHVTIRASELGGDMVQIEVKDSAPPIAEQDRTRIFDQYVRGGTMEDQQRVSGLGLGLAISKSLVTLQKGEIGVTVEPGRGNTFYFTLPAWRENDGTD